MEVMNLKGYKNLLAFLKIYPNENFELNNGFHTLNNLFSDHSKKLEDATDSIRKKYGGNSIFPGIVIKEQ